MFFKPRQLSPLIFLLLSLATSYAQNHKVDSLVNILNKRSRIDTLSVNLMSEIAYQVYANNPSMADDYTQKVIYLSDSLKYKKGIGKGLWLTGLLHLQKDRVRSIDYFKQALAVAEEIRSSIVSLVHPEDLDSLSAFWRTLNVKELSIASVQFRLKHKNEDYRWFEAVAQNFVDNPALGAILSNIRDIDVQKKVGDCFWRPMDLINQLNDTLWKNNYY